MASIEYSLNGLRTYGQTVLVCKDATRGRALEIRKLAAEEGLKVTFRKSAPGVIAMQVQR